MSKRICLFTADFPYGTQETFLENEIQYLAEGLESVFVLPLFSNESFRELKFKNVKVLPAVFKSRKISSCDLILILNPVFWKVIISCLLETGFKISAFKKIIKQAMIIAKMKKYLALNSELFDLDVWYFYWGTNSVNVLPFLDRHPKAIARYHRFDIYGPEIDGGEEQVFQLKTLAKLTQAIFITEHGKNYFLKLFPQYYNKYSISKLGVPERGDSKPSRDGIFRIVTCSNLLSVKRVDLLAKSLLLIDSIHIQWTHFGDGDNSSRASLLKISSGFSNNILFNFKGRVTNSEVMDYYKMNPVDLFCNVSLSEGLPVSIMEALSFGVPVYATDCGGVSELVNDENGKLLNLHLTPESLAIDFKKFYKHKYGDALIRENARKNWANNVNSNDNYRAFIGIINGL